jgi:hypothetical protein
MPFVAPILARSDDESIIKFIFGAIVLVFWLGGVLLSAIKKRVDEAKRRASYGQMPSGFTPPPTVPMPSAGFPPALPKGKVKPAKRAAKRQAPPPPPKPAPAQVASRLAAPPPAPPPQSRAAPATVPPSQIAHLLRRRETLRAALILNEVLSKPLSLRDGNAAGRHV